VTTFYFLALHVAAQAASVCHDPELRACAERMIREHLIARLAP